LGVLFVFLKPSCTMANVNRLPRIETVKVVDLTTMPPTMRWVSILHDVGRPVRPVRAPAVAPGPPRPRGRPAKVAGNPP
jgi:hypothetical protein